MGKKKIAEKVEGIAGTEKTAETAAKTPSKAAARLSDGKILIYINSTYNNTALTATNSKGDVLTWVSAGSLGFSGPKRATPFAAAKVAEALIEKIKDAGKTEVEIKVKGVGSGRDSAVRTLVGRGLNVTTIQDLTPIPHNGPRPPKVRRL